MSQKGADQGREQGHGQSKPGGARRLGRGLSSLIGPAPVRVDVPPEPQTLDSARQYGGVAHSNMSVSNTRPEPAAAAVDTSVATGAARDTALESGATTDDVGDRVVMVAVGDVSPSRFQPREVFDEAKLKELAESIRSIGVMQPILVRSRGGGEAGNGQWAIGNGIEGRNAEGSTGWQAASGTGARGAPADKQPGAQFITARYELVAGERRWRAAQMIGMTHVPAIVRGLSDDESAAWGLIENVQREDLDPIEKGRACRVMMEGLGVSPQDLAARIGLDRSTIVNLVRLTELEAPIQILVRRGEVTMGHAKVLLGVAPENGLRVALATLVSIEGWSVRKLEEEIKKVAKGKTPPSLRATMGLGKEAAVGGVGGVAGVGRSASIADLEKRLGEHLGTRVKIKTDKSGKRGRIEMAFFDLDHFDGLMQRVGFGGK